MLNFYVLEKLIQAVDTLATGSGRVQERIASAALHFLPARPEDLPYEDLRRTFIGIRDDIAFEPPEASEVRDLPLGPAAVGERRVGSYPCAASRMWRLLPLAHIHGLSAGANRRAVENK
jgi:hypothetical protein